MADSFEIWLRTVCFQKPTPEAYDLAKDAWQMARRSALELLAETREYVAAPPTDRYGDSYPESVDVELLGRIDAALAEPINVRLFAAPHSKEGEHE